MTSRRPFALILAATFAACGADTVAQNRGATPASESAPPTPADRLATPVIDVNVRGDGTSDVVLVPGLASPKAVWDDTVDQMGSDYRVHIVGVRGFGGVSADAKAENVFARIVEDMEAYLDTNDLRDVTVIGHSLGGFAALHLALETARVGQVVVVDSLPFYPLVFDPDATVESVSPQAAMMAAQMRALPPDAYAAQARRNAAIMSTIPERVRQIGDWAAASDPDTVVDAMETLMTTDLRPQLPEIRTPVHVLVAHHPAMGVARETYLERWREAYAVLPDLTLTPIDGSFHFIMFDQPEAFAALLQDTLPQ